MEINHIIQKINNSIIKITNDPIQINNTQIGTLINQILFINQIFSNHIHETNKHGKQDISQRHTPYNNNFQSKNLVHTQNYQPTQMLNEILLPHYLQQHEITKTQSTNFSQIPNAAESLQMTLNPLPSDRFSISSNKPLMVFTGTDLEYAVEDYLKAVTANLILNIGPEPINTTLHQNWIHRRKALIQTTLDGAAQKICSVLLIDIKSD